MAKTIPVKLPVELVEIAKARDGGRPPGEVLLEMMGDYLRLEAYAKAIENGGEITSVSEVIIGWHDGVERELKDLKKQVRETMTMFQGMEIFFRRNEQQRR